MYDSNIYHKEYHIRSDGYDMWLKGKLRYGDALAAVAYAVGVESFARVQEIFGFSDGGRSDYDGLDAGGQLGKLFPHMSRLPRGVLDIGSGRCEVPLALASLGSPVQIVEPNNSKRDWLSETWEKMFPNVDMGLVSLCELPCQDCFGQVDLSSVDTLMLVETLEHIPEGDFAKFWEVAKPALARNGGMLVAANWVNYHPLDVTGPEHCRRVDDSIYDWLAEGGRVVFRMGSHLVVQY